MDKNYAEALASLADEMQGLVDEFKFLLRCQEQERLDDEIDTKPLDHDEEVCGVCQAVKEARDGAH